MLRRVCWVGLGRRGLSEFVGGGDSALERSLWACRSVDSLFRTLDASPEEVDGRVASLGVVRLRDLSREAGDGGAPAISSRSRSLSKLLMSLERSWEDGRGSEFVDSSVGALAELVRIAEKDGRVLGSAVSFVDVRRVEKRSERLRSAASRQGLAESVVRDAVIRAEPLTWGGALHRSLLVGFAHMVGLWPSGHVMGMEISPFTLRLGVEALQMARVGDVEVYEELLKVCLMRGVRDGKVLRWIASGLHRSAFGVVAAPLSARWSGGPSWRLPPSSLSVRRGDLDSREVVDRIVDRMEGLKDLKASPIVASMRLRLADLKGGPIEGMLECANVAPAAVAVYLRERLIFDNFLDEEQVEKEYFEAVEQKGKEYFEGVEQVENSHKMEYFAGMEQVGNHHKEEYFEGVEQVGNHHKIRREEIRQALVDMTEALKNDTGDAATDGVAAGATFRLASMVELKMAFPEECRMLRTAATMSVKRVFLDISRMFKTEQDILGLAHAAVVYPDLAEVCREHVVDRLQTKMHPGAAFRRATFFSIVEALHQADAIPSSSFKDWAVIRSACLFFMLPRQWEGPIVQSDKQVSRSWFVQGIQSLRSTRMGDSVFNRLSSKFSHLDDADDEHHDLQFSDPKLHDSSAPTIKQKGSLPDLDDIVAWSQISLTDDEIGIMASIVRDRLWTSSDRLLQAMERFLLSQRGLELWRDISLHQNASPLREHIKHDLLHSSSSSSSSSSSDSDETIHSPSLQSQKPDHTTHWGLSRAHSMSYANLVHVCGAFAKASIPSPPLMELLLNRIPDAKQYTPEIQLKILCDAVQAVANSHKPAQLEHLTHIPDPRSNVLQILHSQPSLSVEALTNAIAICTGVEGLRKCGISTKSLPPLQSLTTLNTTLHSHLSTKLQDLSGIKRDEKLDLAGVTLIYSLLSTNKTLETTTFDILVSLGIYDPTKRVLPNRKKTKRERQVLQGLQTTYDPVFDLLFDETNRAYRIGQPQTGNSIVLDTLAEQYFGIVVIKP